MVLPFIQETNITGNFRVDDENSVFLVRWITQSGECGE